MSLENNFKNVKEECYVVNCLVLDKLVNTVFDLSADSKDYYEFVVAEEVLCGTARAYEHITRKEYQTPSFQLNVHKLLKHDWQCNTRDILVYLCHNGYIPEGNYLIKANW